MCLWEFAYEEEQVLSQVVQSLLASTSHPTAEQNQEKSKIKKNNSGIIDV